MFLTNATLEEVRCACKSESESDRQETPWNSDPNNLSLSSDSIYYEESQTSDIINEPTTQSCQNAPKSCGSPPLEIRSESTTSIDLPPITWHGYNCSPQLLTISNTGRKILIEGQWASGKPYIQGGPLNGSYMFSQIHFHCPSEHEIDGKRFPLEMHVVHFKTSYLTQERAMEEKDGTVVLVYLFQVEDSVCETALSCLTKKCPYIQTANTQAEIKGISLNHLVKPFHSHYYIYWGSVSTRKNCYLLQWIINCTNLCASKQEVYDLYHLMLSCESNDKKRSHFMKPVNNAVYYAGSYSSAVGSPMQSSSHHSNNPSNKALATHSCQTVLIKEDKNTKKDVQQQASSSGYNLHTCNVPPNYSYFISDAPEEKPPSNTISIIKSKTQVPQSNCAHHKDGSTQEVPHSNCGHKYNTAEGVPHSNCGHHKNNSTQEVPQSKCAHHRDNTAEGVPRSNIIQIGRHKNNSTQEDPQSRCAHHRDNPAEGVPHSNMIQISQQTSNNAQEVQQSNCAHHANNSTQTVENPKCGQHTNNSTQKAPPSNCPQHSNNTTQGAPPSNCPQHSNNTTQGAPPSNCPQHSNNTTQGATPSNCPQHSNNTTQGATPSNCPQHSNNTTQGATPSNCPHHPCNTSKEAPNTNCPHQANNSSSNSQASKCSHHSATEKSQNSNSNSNCDCNAETKKKIDMKNLVNFDPPDLLTDFTFKKMPKCDNTDPAEPSRRPTVVFKDENPECEKPKNEEEDKCKRLKNEEENKCKRSKNEKSGLRALCKLRNKKKNCETKSNEAQLSDDDDDDVNKCESREKQGKPKEIAKRLKRCLSKSNRKKLAEEKECCEVDTPKTKTKSKAQSKSDVKLQKKNKNAKYKCEKEEEPPMEECKETEKPPQDCTINFLLAPSPLKTPSLILVESDLQKMKELADENAKVSVKTSEGSASRKKQLQLKKKEFSPQICLETEHFFRTESKTDFSKCVSQDYNVTILSNQNILQEFKGTFSPKKLELGNNEKLDLVPKYPEPENVTVEVEDCIVKMEKSDKLYIRSKFLLKQLDPKAIKSTENKSLKQISSHLSKTLTVKPEAKKVAAKTKSKIATVKSEGKTVPAKTESKIATVKSEGKTVPAKTESKMATVKPEEKTVPAKSESKIPILKPEGKTVPTKTESKVATVKSEEKTVPAKSESKIPILKPEGKTVPAKKESKTLTIKPEAKTVPAKSESKIPILIPEGKTVAAKKESKTLTIKPEAKPKDSVKECKVTKKDSIKLKDSVDLKKTKSKKDQKPKQSLDKFSSSDIKLEKQTYEINLLKSPPEELETSKSNILDFSDDPSDKVDDKESTKSLARKSNNSGIQGIFWNQNKTLFFTYDKVEKDKISGKKIFVGRFRTENEMTALSQEKTLYLNNSSLSPSEKIEKPKQCYYSPSRKEFVLKQSREKPPEEKERKIQPSSTKIKEPKGENKEKDMIILHKYNSKEFAPKKLKSGSSHKSSQNL